jgi:hypothetical protein
VRAGKVRLAMLAASSDSKEIAFVCVMVRTLPTRQVGTLWKVTDMRPPRMHRQNALNAVPDSLLLSDLSVRWAPFFTSAGVLFALRCHT